MINAKTIISIILIIFVGLTLNAQQKHDQLRELYLKHSAEDTDADSIHIYAFKTKDASFKEYGDTSLQYIRALHNIGVSYLNTSRPDSALFWLLKGYKESVKLNSVGFPALKTAFYNNLRIAYLYHIPNLDSAMLFANKYIDASRVILHNDQRLFINLTANLAAQFEEVFGLEVANKYYLLSLNERSKFFGKVSSDITWGIDSILRSDSVTNTVGQRLRFYIVSDTAYTKEKIDRFPGPPSTPAGSWTSIREASEMMIESLRLYGDTSARFTSSLIRFGLGHHNWLQEDIIALFILDKGQEILRTKKLESSVLYLEVSQAIAKVNRDIGNYDEPVFTIENQTSPQIRPNENNSFNDQVSVANLMLPIGHPQGIRDAKVSPDGKYVISRSYNDVNAKIWSASTGELIYNLPMEKGIWQVHFTPDSRSVLTSGGTKIAIWDIFTGRQKVAFQNPDSLLFDNILITTHNSVITTSANNLRIWDAGSGNVIKHVKFLDTITDIKKTRNDSVIVVTTSHGNHGSMSRFNFVSQQTKSITKGQSFQYLFSDKSFVLFTEDKAVIYDLFSFKIKSVFDLDKGWPTNGSLSASGDRLVLSFADSTISAFDTATGEELSGWKLSTPVTNVALVGNGDKYIYYDFYHRAYLMETDGDQLDIFESDRVSSNRAVGSFINFSADKKYVLMVSSDNVLRMWKLSGERAILNQEFFGKTVSNSANTGSRDSKYIAIGNTLGAVKVFNLNTGTFDMQMQADSAEIRDLVFSPDSKYLFATSEYGCRVFEFPNGKLVKTLTQTDFPVYVDISKDGKYLLTNATHWGDGRLSDTVIRIWDWKEGKVFKAITSSNRKGYFNANFSKDSRSVVYKRPDSSMVFWDIESGEQKLVLAEQDWVFEGREEAFNIVSTSTPFYVNLLDKQTGTTTASFATRNENGSGGYDLSEDGKTLVIGTSKGELNLWDASSGKNLKSVKAHSAGVVPTILQGDSILLSASEDGTIKVWDLKSLSMRYQIVPVNDDDYLIIDPYNRYDGTEAARRLLYFTCGTEVISLEQVKDQLWVPNLAERIIKGEKINAAKLADLDICGLTPQVESLEGEGIYKFKILPRKGGLGETVLFVNGIEVRRYASDQLIKTGGGFELILTQQELQAYFVSGQENPVTVKSFTAKNDISSRGAIAINRKSESSKTPPNLYAVIVGVSDYKGDELDLKYAAKDAADISNALGASARKLLNIDGKEHVFIYNLHTGTERDQLPEKLSIKNTLAEIGRKATANDILLVFFAGHGVMQGEEKQFYFLTADASGASALSGAAEVGISTAELSEWMQPSSIKAQKRILIFDACNSGQAVNELVKIGETEQQYLAARNDDNSQQIKAIEKLNEKSGMFILSASASNQSAYEMGRFSQGLLTYSLLKAMKEQPDILEDNNLLNVSRWFGAAEKTVGDIIRETGNRQQPQIVSAGNFNIGIVDQEVISKIILPKEKALFIASNFQNDDDDIADDDLEFSKTINRVLSTISSRGAESTITYITGSNSPDAFSLSGRYEVQGDNITVRVNIRQNKQIIHRLEVKGLKSKLDLLAEDLVKQAAGFVGSL